MALDVIIPQADSSIKGGRTGETAIVPLAAYTASDTAGPWPVDYFSSAEIQVAVTTCSGTLNVYVQKLLPDGSTYDDVASFSQYTTAVYTTTGNKVLSFVNGGNTLNTQGSAALTANSVLTVHFGNYWRVNWVLAGTGATATFAVYGSFKK